MLEAPSSSQLPESEVTNLASQLTGTKTKILTLSTESERVRSSVESKFARRKKEAMKEKEARDLIDDAVLGLDDAVLTAVEVPSSASALEREMDDLEELLNSIDRRILELKEMRGKNAEFLSSHSQLQTQLDASLTDLEAAKGLGQQRLDRLKLAFDSIPAQSTPSEEEETSKALIVESPTQEHEKLLPETAAELNVSQNVPEMEGTDDKTAEDFHSAEKTVAEKTKEHEGDHNKEKDYDFKATEDEVKPTLEESKSVEIKELSIETEEEKLEGEQHIEQQVQDTSEDEEVDVNKQPIESDTFDSSKLKKVPDSGIDQSEFKLPILLKGDEDPTLPLEGDIEVKDTDKETKSESDSEEAVSVVSVLSNIEQSKKDSNKREVHQITEIVAARKVVVKKVVMIEGVEQEIEEEIEGGEDETDFENVPRTSSGEIIFQGLSLSQESEVHTPEGYKETAEALDLTPELHEIEPGLPEDLAENLPPELAHLVQTEMAKAYLKLSEEEKLMDDQIEKEIKEKAEEKTPPKQPVLPEVSTEDLEELVKLVDTLPEEKAKDIYDQIVEAMKIAGEKPSLAEKKEELIKLQMEQNKLVPDLLPPELLETLPEELISSLRDEVRKSIPKLAEDDDDTARFTEISDDVKVEPEMEQSEVDDKEENKPKVEFDESLVALQMEQQKLMPDMPEDMKHSLPEDLTQLLEGEIKNAYLKLAEEDANKTPDNEREEIKDETLLEKVLLDHDDVVKSNDEKKITEVGIRSEELKSTEEFKQINEASMDEIDSHLEDEFPLDETDLSDTKESKLSGQLQELEQPEEREDDRLLEVAEPIDETHLSDTKERKSLEKPQELEQPEEREDDSHRELVEPIDETDLSDTKESKLKGKPQELEQLEEREDDSHLEVLEPINEADLSDTKGSQLKEKLQELEQPEERDEHLKKKQENKDSYKRESIKELEKKAESEEETSVIITKRDATADAITPSSDCKSRTEQYDESDRSEVKTQEVESEKAKLSEMKDNEKDPTQVPDLVEKSSPFSSDGESVIAGNKPLDQKNIEVVEPKDKIEDKITDNSMIQTEELDLEGKIEVEKRSISPLSVDAHEDEVDVGQGFESEGLPPTPAMKTPKLDFERPRSPTLSKARKELFKVDSTASGFESEALPPSPGGETPRLDFERPRSPTPSKARKEIFKADSTVSGFESEALPPSSGGETRRLDIERPSSPTPSKAREELFKVDSTASGFESEALPPTPGGETQSLDIERPRSPTPSKARKELFKVDSSASGFEEASVMLDSQMKSVYKKVVDEENERTHQDEKLKVMIPLPKTSGGVEQEEGFESEALPPTPGGETPRLDFERPRSPTPSKASKELYKVDSSASGLEEASAILGPEMKNIAQKLVDEEKELNTQRPELKVVIPEAKFREEDVDQEEGFESEALPPTPAIETPRPDVERPRGPTPAEGTAKRELFKVGSAAADLDERIDDSDKKVDVDDISMKRSKKPKKKKKKSKIKKEGEEATKEEQMVKSSSDEKDVVKKVEEGDAEVKRQEKVEDESRVVLGMEEVGKNVHIDQDQDRDKAPISLADMPKEEAKLEKEGEKPKKEQMSESFSAKEDQSEDKEEQSQGKKGRQRRRKKKKKKSQDVSEQEPIKVPEQSIDEYGEVGEKLTCEEKSKDEIKLYREDASEIEPNDNEDKMKEVEKSDTDTTLRVYQRQETIPVDDLTIGQSEDEKVVTVEEKLSDEALEDDPGDENKSLDGLRERMETQSLQIDISDDEKSSKQSTEQGTEENVDKEEKEMMQESEPKRDDDKLLTESCQVEREAENIQMIKESQEHIITVDSEKDKGSSDVDDGSEAVLSMKEDFKKEGEKFFVDEENKSVSVTELSEEEKDQGSLEEPSQPGKKKRQRKRKKNKKSEMRNEPEVDLDDSKKKEEQEQSHLVRVASQSPTEEDSQGVEKLTSESVTRPTIETSKDEEIIESKHHTTEDQTVEESIGMKEDQSHVGMEREKSLVTAVSQPSSDHATAVPLDSDHEEELGPHFTAEKINQEETVIVLKHDTEVKPEIEIPPLVDEVVQPTSESQSPEIQANTTVQEREDLIPVKVDQAEDGSSSVKTSTPEPGIETDLSEASPRDLLLPILDRSFDYDEPMEMETSQELDVKMDSLSEIQSGEAVAGELCKIIKHLHQHLIKIQGQIGSAEDDEEIHAEIQRLRMLINRARSMTVQVDDNQFGSGLNLACDDLDAGLKSLEREIVKLNDSVQESTLEQDAIQDINQIQGLIGQFEHIEEPLQNHEEMSLLQEKLKESDSLLESCLERIPHLQPRLVKDITETRVKIARLSRESDRKAENDLNNEDKISEYETSLEKLSDSINAAKNQQTGLDDRDLEKRRKEAFRLSYEVPQPIRSLHSQLASSLIANADELSNLQIKNLAKKSLDESNDKELYQKLEKLKCEFENIVSRVAKYEQGHIEAEHVMKASNELEVIIYSIIMYLACILINYCSFSDRIAKPTTS